MERTSCLKLVFYNHSLWAFIRLRTACHSQKQGAGGSTILIVKKNNAAESNSLQEKAKNDLLPCGHRDRYELPVYTTSSVLLWKGQGFKDRKARWRQGRWVQSHLPLQEWFLSKQNLSLGVGKFCFADWFEKLQTGSAGTRIVRNFVQNLCAAHVWANWCGIC